MAGDPRGHGSLKPLPAVSAIAVLYEPGIRGVNTGGREAIPLQPREVVPGVHR